MRAVIQKVKSASIIVDGQMISKIEKGLCVLIGISRDDSEVDGDYICNKILNLCLFDHPETGKRWSQSVTACNYEVLCVSQFTLYSALKGNKLDFHCSMEADKSRIMYQNLVDKMKQLYRPELIKDGQFGAMMEVNIVNDGPVTINIESPAHLKDNKGNKNSNKKHSNNVETIDDH